MHFQGELLNAVDPKLGPSTNSSKGDMKRVFISLLLLFLTRSFPAGAATLTWTNLLDTQWSRSTNWSPNIVPGPGDTVIISGPASYVVNLDASLSVASLVVGGGGGVQNFYQNNYSFTNTVGATVNANGIFDLNNGTYYGAATVNGTFSWTAGMVATGSVVNVTAAGVLALSGSQNKNLNGTINLSGAGTWTGTGFLIGNNAGAFNILVGGILTAQSDTEYYYGSGVQPSLTVLGTLRKNGTAGTTSIGTGGGLYFTNYGSVEAQMGTLNFVTSGNSPGTFTTSAGATILFSGIGNGPLGVSGLLTGAGTNRMVGGTVNLVGQFNVGTLELAGANLTGGVTNSGLFSWTSGTLVAGATVGVSSGGTLSLAGPANKFLNGTLNLAGSGTWSGSGFIYGGSGGAFNILSGAVFTAQNDTEFYYGSGALPSFTILGTFRKSGGAGTTSIGTGGGLYFTNAGIVDVQSGTISFSTVGTSSGTFSNAAGATTLFAGTGYGPMAATGLLTGAGTNRLVNATVNLNGSFTIGTLELAGANLTGGFTNSAIFNWTSGTIVAGATVGVGPSGTLNLSGSANKFLNGTLNLSGSGTWNGTGYIYGGSGGAFNILPSALFVAQNDTEFYYGSGVQPSFTIQGTFRKSGGTATTSIGTGGGIFFTNLGNVDVQSGTVNFSTIGASSGTFSTAAGATTLLSGTGNGSMSVNGLLTGAGTNRLTGFTVNLNGAFSAGTLELAGANLTGALTNSGIFNWTSGTIASGSTVGVGPSGSLNLSGVSHKFLNGTLNHAGGSGTWTGSGYIYGGNGGALTILAGGLLVAQSDSDFYYGTGVQPSFNVVGTFRKNGTFGTTSIGSGGGIFFTNNGTVEVLTGLLKIYGNYAPPSGSQITIGLAGKTAGTQFGQVQVTGAITPNGVFNLALQNGFVPAANDAFPVVSFASRAGTFPTVSGRTLPGGLYFVPNYSSTNLSFSAVDGRAKFDTTALQLTNKQFRFTVLAPGPSYVIEVSTNLTNWSGILTSASAGGLISFVDTNVPTIPYRFYRAIFAP